MEYRRLGQAWIKVSPICLGAGVRGELDEQRVIRTPVQPVAPLGGGTDLLNICRRYGLGLMTYSPLAVGLLSGRFRRGVRPSADTYWDAARLQQALSASADGVIQTLVDLANQRGRPGPSWRSPGCSATQRSPPDRRGRSA